ncbi:MAG: cyclic nucleotide-binding domain-containing protein [Candidatus Dormibacteria bacterium]
MSILTAKTSREDVIRRVPIFEQCSKRELEFLASEMDEIEVASGAILTRQGRQGHTFYVLLDGEAEVLIDGTRRALLGPGEFFGEVSMIDRGPATATVIATRACTLMVMSHVQFRDAIRAHQNIAIQVMTAMAQRLRDNAGAGFDSGRIIS